ncbi:lytic transglycosylase domain-containing protein [Actinomadura hibisca]|uniref:aggregation-promoting factor C-terminal-like domain-containing protein n=1 Tax=Actinomadura hibisca TaxID=68565 RepID=UPI000ADB295F|nr:lytic transglycosylase domain-containing protein [Actinomadura hibisca]
MSTFIRTGLRAAALGAATTLVVAPMTTAPVEATPDGTARSAATARLGNGLERREPKLTEIRDRELKRVARNKRIARAMMAKLQWGSAQQFRCLERLWAHESGWDEGAHNGATGAHGIPQAMPGPKMSSAGPNWRSDPRTQIRWGLRYIKYRHGTPCGAWGHFRAAGWY